MSEILKNTFNIVGQYGPIILNFETIYLLWNKSNLLVYYLFGACLNFMLNFVLKGIFKEPRPLEDPKLFNIALKNGVRFKFANGVPYDIFGMPSNHAQEAFYSTIFIHLALNNVYVTLLYLIISLITMYQRVDRKSHSVIQVIAGAMVGSSFAYFIYYMASKKIIGKINTKKDDNAKLT